MKYCVSPKMLENGTAFVLLSLAVGTLVTFCFIEPIISNSVVGTIWYSITLFWLIIWIVFCRSIVLKLRKYQLTNSGIHIKDFLKKPVFHKWQAVTEIGICKVHYTHRTPVRYDTVIRLVIGHENSGPSNGFGMWQSEIYEAFHQKAVICIEYSEQLLFLLQTLYSGEIVDYRHIVKNAYDTPQEPKA